MQTSENYRRKVLVVEDDFYFFDLLAGFFTDKGFEVIRDDEDSFVDSYFEAVRLCELVAPDLAILDIELKRGQKDGIDLAYWLKDQFNIPVIFVSGKGNPEYAERTVGMREVLYLSKVTTREELGGLWFNIQRLLPADNDGQHFNVRSIPTDYFLNKKNSIETFKSEFGNHRDKPQFFRYKSIKEIIVPEKHWGTNCVVFVNSNGKYYHIAQKSLSYYEGLLPRQFIRVDSRTLVNSDWIDPNRIENDSFYIGQQKYSISKNIEAASKSLAVLETLRLGKGL